MSNAVKWEASMPEFISFGSGSWQSTFERHILSVFVLYRQFFFTCAFHGPIEVWVIQCGQMLSSNLLFKPDREIAFQRPAANTSFQYHYCTLCMVGIQRDFSTDALAMLASITCKPAVQKKCMHIWMRQWTPIVKWKQIALGNIVETMWLQPASKRPTTSILLNTSRWHFCKSKLLK